MYGAFIRSVRASRGMSQTTLAGIVDISQPNLSAYERDRRVPSPDTLNQIVVACGYELAAVDGDRTLFCPLPAGGWFPEDPPPREAADPPDEPLTVSAGTPMSQRVRAIQAVLELADATR